MAEVSPGAKRQRVPAMAPDERRAAIVRATVPLLREHGLAVSTRQIATAAGVAEGTLFGVFPDKAALLRAAVISVLDPAPAVAAIEDIDPGADLRERLCRALDILRDRFDRNSALIAALRATGIAGTREDAEGARHLFGEIHRSRTCVVDAIAALIEPDRARLRRSPATTAHLLFMIMMSNSRAVFAGDVEAMDNEEIVSLLLDGLLLREGDRHGGGRT